MKKQISKEVSHFRKEHNVTHLASSFESSINCTVYSRNRAQRRGFMEVTEWIRIWHRADWCLLLYSSLYLRRRLWHWMSSSFSPWSAQSFYINNNKKPSFTVAVYFSVCHSGSRPCWPRDGNLSWAEKECTNGYDIQTSTTALQRPRRHLRLLEEPG